jgi:translin
MNLSEITASVNERLDVLEDLREKSIAVSRSVIRKTKRVIHSIHSGTEHQDMLSDALGEFGPLRDMRNEPEIFFSGPVSDAMTELAEACILSSLVRGAELPLYSDIDITPQSWALGLADCLGEMRRLLLTYLMDSRMSEAKDMFNKMEDVCEAVLSFDVPDALLPIRRKQDVARSVMERTHTDITNALMMEKITGHLPRF